MNKKIVALTADRESLGDLKVFADETLIEVLKHLSPNERTTAHQVCQIFNRLTKSDAYWQQRFETVFNVELTRTEFHPEPGWAQRAFFEKSKLWIADEIKNFAETEEALRSFFTKILQLIPVEIVLYSVLDSQDLDSTIEPFFKAALKNLIDDTEKICRLAALAVDTPDLSSHKEKVFNTLFSELPRDVLRTIIRERDSLSIALTHLIKKEYEGKQSAYSKSIHIIHFITTFEIFWNFIFSSGVQKSFMLRCCNTMLAVLIAARIFEPMVLRTPPECRGGKTLPGMVLDNIRNVVNSAWFLTKGLSKTIYEICKGNYTVHYSRGGAS